MVWIDHSYDMVRFQEIAKYGWASGVDFGPVDVVRFAKMPDQIYFTIKKAFDIQDPVIIDVEVDYRDLNNHHRSLTLLFSSFFLRTSFISNMGEIFTFSGGGIVPVFHHDTANTSLDLQHSMMLLQLM